MKLPEIVSLLANRINQPHIIEHYLKKVIEGASKDDWISIKDKLPKKGEKVFGYRPYAKDFGDEEFTVLEYEDSVSIDHKGNTHGFERIHFISHWKPLLKPLKQ